MKYFLGAINFRREGAAGESVRRFASNHGIHGSFIFDTPQAAFVSPRVLGKHHRCSHDVYVNCEPEAKISLIDSGPKCGERDGSGHGSSHSVVRALYRRHGRLWASFIRSDHVTSIWDPGEKRLLLSRDRFGSRALYYTQEGDTFLFSNRLACLFLFPGVSRELCQEAALDFLLFGKHNNLRPDLTPFRDIKALPPASALLKTPTECSIFPYWTFPSESEVRPIESAKETISAFAGKLSDSISRRLDERRTLIALSGGLDSTTVTALALRSGSGVLDRFRAFTVAESDESEEFRVAAAAARHLGVRHHRFDDSRFHLLDDSSLCLVPTENPFPQKYVDLHAYTSSRAENVLTAGAADNLLFSSPVSFLGELRFAGPGHAVKAAVSHQKMFSRRIRVGLRKQRQPIHTAYPMPEWIRMDCLYKGSVQERWRGFWEASPVSLHVRHPNVHKGMVCVNWDRDLALLDFKLDSANRIDPFFDVKLLEFVLSLPPLPWFQRKALIRQLARTLLPDVVARRKKSAAEDRFASSLRQTELTRFNDIHSDEFVLELVDLDRWRPIFPGMSVLDRYLNFRVLALSRWVRQIRRLT